MGIILAIARKHYFGEFGKFPAIRGEWMILATLRYIMKKSQNANFLEQAWYIST